MKKTLLIASCAIALTFSSCKKATTITNELDGEIWKVVKVEEVNGSKTNTNNDPKWSFTFDKDGGKGKETMGGLTWDITWSVADDKVTITAFGSEVYTVKKSGWSKQTWEVVDGGTITTYELEKQ